MADTQHPVLQKPLDGASHPPHANGTVTDGNPPRIDQLTLNAKSPKAEKSSSGHILTGKQEHCKHCGLILVQTSKAHVLQI